LNIYCSSESWHKGSSAPSVRSLVVDEERMRPGYLLGLVLCILPFSALTLMARWEEGHPARKRTSYSNPTKTLSKSYS